MQHTTNHTYLMLSRYGLALAAVLIALLLRLLLTPVLGNQAPFLFFWPVIMLSGLYGGQGPGMLAVGSATALAAWFLLSPLSSLAVDDPGQQLVLALFAVQGAVLSVLAGALRAARHRAERDLALRTRAEQRLRVQYAVGRVLADARTFDAAVPGLLSSIGTTLGWPVGQFWRMHADDDALHVMTLWHTPELNAEDSAALEAASRTIQLRRGVGLPGEVCQRGEPRWLPNLENASNFPRRDIAARLGLHSAFAFPIRGSHGLIGVMEFLSTDERAPDPDLLDTVATIGTHIGQFVDRLHAEHAVRSSEARKAAVFAAALDAIITMDHMGRVTEWNGAAETLFGYDNQFASGQLLADLIIPPTLRDAHHHGLQRYLTSGEGPLIGQRIEVEAVRADGGTLPVELSITRLPTDGPPVFTGFVRDLTVRKHAEQAVRFQAQLLDTVDEAVIATDVAGTIIYWNHFAETLYGWSSAEAIGRNIVDVTPAPMTKAQAEVILEQLRQGERWSGEVMLQRRNGTTFPALVTDTPVYDEQGQLVAIVGVSLDISERKQTEDAHRFLAEASAVLASSLDDTTILQHLAQLAVPRLADWCAVDLVEADGAFRRLAVAHVDPDKVELAWELERRYGFDPNLPEGAAKVLRTGQSVLYPVISDTLLTHVAQDPEHLHLLQRVGLRSGMIVPLVARERILGAISLGAAESTRTFEPADLRLAEDLARRAALAVDNARLYQEAKAAVQLRDDFLTIAAHELRTPVTALLGHCQLVQRRAAREGTLGERNARTLQVIEAQAERLTRLINSLLAVSRLATGHFHLDRHPFNLAELVQRLYGEVQPLLEDRQLELSCPDEPVLVNGDPLRLEQVVQNLIQNAVKYSPARSIITVSLEQEDDRAILAVADQGVGIPAAALPQLFQRFFRAASNAHTNTAGMGIGLYVVHEIVSRHGGRVEVTSEEGGGSTFRVVLPLDTTASVSTGASSTSAMHPHQ